MTLYLIRKPRKPCNLYIVLCFLEKKDKSCLRSLSGFMKFVFSSIYKPGHYRHIAASQHFFSYQSNRLSIDWNLKVEKLVTRVEIPLKNRSRYERLERFFSKIWAVWAVWAVWAFFWKNRSNRSNLAWKTAHFLRWFLNGFQARFEQ